MKPLADFFSRLIPWVPGCPEPTANQALVDSAIAFCEDSLVLRERLETFQTVAGQAEYELDAPAQQQVARILAVQVGNTAVDLLPAENSAFPPDTRGQPSIAYSTRTGSEFLLHLYPVPDAAYPVDVQVSLRPMRGATQLEDDLYNLWSEAIVAGAVSRLCSIPGQPFTDFGVSTNASMHAVRWANKARIEGSSNRVRGNLIVRQRPFA